MNLAIDLNYSDYIINLGNRFFNLNNNDFYKEVDDLLYEDIDESGLNGYVMKIAGGQNKVTSLIYSRLAFVVEFLMSFFSKKKGEGEQIQVERIWSTQNMINNKVRSRLLRVINEDVESWSDSINNRLQSKNPSDKRKNRLRVLE